MKGKNLSLLSEQERFRTLVEKEGLVCLGFVPLHSEKRFHEFEHWIHKKKHGEMSFLENYRDLRKEPERILPGAKQAIVIGFPYYQGDKHRFGKSEKVRIAQYARFSDYHKTLKKKCERILDEILNILPEGHYGRVLVDPAPILERALADRAQEVFIGKNTMLIHPEWGSYLLLCEIFLSFPLEKLEEENISQKTSCGTCTRRQVHCPTGALTPYSLDATKCLAYYTIEHRSTIPVQFWPYLKDYIFGCDICQLVCPFNRGVKVAKNLALKISEFPPLSEVVMMDQTYYERVFGGTPLTRAKRSGLRRNALIAMVASKDEQLERVLELLKHEEDPLILKTIEQIPLYRGSIHG